MEAIWSTPARLQLTKIVMRVAEEDPIAALNLDEMVDKKVQLLVKFPYSGRIGRVPGTREAIVGNYILVYEIREEKIAIDCIFHGAMKYP